MNFILFTNQGYPLRNCSLGQLHSDEALFPLFVAVLEGFCWNTFQLISYTVLDIIQSTKMAPFQVIFEPGEEKEVTGTEIQRIGGLRNHRNAFFCQKFIDGDCPVTWGVVVVQHTCACNAWSHMCHPFPESFKDFLIKSMTVCPGGTNRLWTIP